MQDDVTPTDPRPGQVFEGPYKTRRVIIAVESDAILHGRLDRLEYARWSLAEWSQWTERARLVRESEEKEEQDG